MNFAATDCDVRDVATLALVPVSALQVLASRPAIAVVSRRIRQPQVRDAIVVPDSIDVVNLGVRPFAVHKEPSQPMRGIDAVFEADLDVSPAAVVPSFFANWAALAGELPGEFAGVRVIVERVNNVVRRRCGKGIRPFAA